MKVLIKTQAMLRQLKKAGKALRQEYFLLCRKDKLTEDECEFAALYPDMSQSITALLKEKAALSSGINLAEQVILQSGNRPANTEKVIMIISGVMAQRKVTSQEIETLKNALTFEIITSLPPAIKSGEYANLLNKFAGINQIDFNEITAACDPLHAYLFEADETYRDSDTETKRQYRRIICDISHTDELSTAKELLEYADKNSLDLSEVLLPSHHKSSYKAIILALCYLLIAVSVCVGASIFALEWWVAPMLLLPALCTAKAVVDKALLWGRKPLYLWRLSETSHKVKDEKLAAVFYTVLGENSDINKISDKLKKLSCTLNSENAKVVLLIDQSGEQAPAMPDDNLAFSSVNEMIARLNENERERYAAVIRKRTFSESQEEYVGFGGKRGALLELCRFMQTGTHGFAAVFGDIESLVGTQYIADIGENLTPELNAIGTLLQIALHPCNLPKVKNGKVYKGWGIISPNIRPKLESALANGFSRVFALKPHKADIFNELLGEASFSGVGLINSALYLQMQDMIPPEKSACPEILEGEWLKCINASDVNFYSTFPDTPQRFYRRLMHTVRGSVYSLPYAFKKQFGISSRIKLIGRFIHLLVPVSVMANMYFAFWLYPKACEFAAIAGLALWLLPDIFIGIRHLAYSVVMLPTLAQKSFWAVIVSSVRGVTGKRLFNHDLAPSDPLSFYILPMLLSLALFYSPGYTVRLFALLFALMPALLALSEHESIKKESKLSFKETKDLTQYVSDSWKFFNEYVTEADNDLPPKSVQFSPVYRISHTTGPKEIGLYLMSCLGAYDLKLITAQTMAARIEKCLDSTDKLEKFKGCLYKSYNTVNLNAESDEILSEDMGVYVSSLVCLNEGMRELGKVYDKAQILTERIDRMINSTDLSIFYDAVSGLMCKSINISTGLKSSDRHEHLMSISRLCSFYAIAKRDVPKKHWQSLKRETLKSGFYSGLGSPTGGIEEYFLPEIFLKSPQGSAFYESLRFSLFVHKKAGLAKGLPFGLSESGVYLFNSSLGYRTQKLGALKSAISSQSPSRYAVSPHSSMLALSYSAHACAENLLKLKKSGAYGSFGFFDAIDYTSGSGEEVVKMLDASHVGQIILGGVNVLDKGIIQKRTANSPHVLGAIELLEERPAPSPKTARKPKAVPCHSSEREAFDTISPYAPRIKLLNNGGYSLLLTDSGSSIALRKGLCVYEMTREPSFNKRGIFSAVKTQNEVVMLDSPDGLTCSFTDSGVSYCKSDGVINACMSVSLHKTLACEIRHFKLKNMTDTDIDANLLIYCEPALLKPHVANSERKQLSMRLERDDKLKVITVSRADADCSQCIAIGFYEDIQMQSSFDKDSVFSECDSITDIFENSDNIAPSLVSEPEPCVFIKSKLRLKADAESEATMFILAADSMDELNTNIVFLRTHELNTHTQASTKALVMAQLMLPDILFKKATVTNKAFVKSTWLMPKVPLTLLPLNNKNDEEKLSTFLGAYKVIRRAGIALQMAAVFNDGGMPEREHYSKLLKAAKECDALSFIYAQSGILPIDEFELDENISTELYKSAAFVAGDEILPETCERKPYKRIVISKVLPDSPKVEEPISCGGFNGSEYIVADRPQIKWRHVLSNPVFGAVVENASLGVTSFGNFNEQLILELDGSYYNLVNGAAACFSPNFASYKAKGDGFKSEVKVSVSQKGMCKKLEVKITACQKCRLAYVFEAQNAIGVKKTDKEVIIDLGKRLASIAADKMPTVVFDKEAFFNGDWENNTKTNNGFCAAIVTLSGAEETNIYLSFGASEKAVTKMPMPFVPHKKEKNSLKHERELLWGKYQLINCCTYLGDGTGKLNFGNLLQNACALTSADPKRCKTEILRCAYHQFSDGDACAEWVKGGKAGKERTAQSLAHLWLPLAVCEYVTKTGNYAFLDIGVRYFDSSSQKESVYEHCRRAIDISVDKKGIHGIVLDSDERESVWLSEFMVVVLERFCEITRRKGDNMYSVQLMHQIKKIKEAIASYCKDSGQYIGGYLPSGETWGSTKNDTCKITLLPQVTAQFAHLDEYFDKCALWQAYTLLCDAKRGVTKLFAPPFDSDSETVPYEAMYLPTGIKQNGGQITAAAIWLAEALKYAGFQHEAKSVYKTVRPEQMAKNQGYKQEPYYICGEVFANKNCYGRGAEPIFNSAAAWYYKFLCENTDCI